MLIWYSCSYADTFKKLQVSKKNDIEYLFYEQQMQNLHLKPEEAKTFARLWLQKAKREKQDMQLFKAYKAVMFKDKKEFLPLYADSLIIVARRIKDNKCLGTAYLTKGIIAYNQKELVEATDNFLIADHFLALTKAEYDKFKLKYALAQAKYYLGYYEEAVALLKNCEPYFLVENDQAYLNTLHSLALCYNKLKEYQIADYYINLGLKECEELEESKMENYFKHAKAINQHYLEEYEEAIVQLTDLMPFLIEQKDYPNQTLANFYIGRSYWYLNQQKQAIPYLLEVDKSYDTNDYIKPELVENYELLAHYFESRNHAEYLKYLKKWANVQKILTEKQSYLSKKLRKEYDNKNAQIVQKKMLFENRRISIILSIVIIDFVFLAYRYLSNRKKYLNFAKNAREIQDKPNNELIQVHYDRDTLDISPDIVAKALKKLEKFEKSKKYLENDMSLRQLGDYMNINGKYAARIVLKYRNKKVVSYINDLKIQYIIDVLENDNKSRYYSNAALGEEAGFGSTQNFIRAFKNFTKATPMSYIQQLKSSETNKMKQENEAE